VSGQPTRDEGPAAHAAIVAYIRDNQGKYPLDAIVGRVRQAGHSEAAIAAAVSDIAGVRAPSQVHAPPAVVTPFRKGLLVGGAIVVVGFVALLLLLPDSGNNPRATLTATGPSQAASVAPTASASAASAEQPITLQGTGKANTAPFELAGGDYVVTWSVRSTSTIFCTFGVVLSSPDGSANEPIASARVDNETTSTAGLYGVRPGRYFLAVGKDQVFPEQCEWKITIAPTT
jgi:hypothetical protein